MTPPSASVACPPASRPLTDREVARLNDFLAAGTSLDLYQQRALAAEVLRLREAAAGQDPRGSNAVGAP